MRFIPFAVLLALFAVRSLPASAKQVGRPIRCNQLPASWQPAISFYQVGKSSGSGVIFFEVAQEPNRGIGRIRQLHYVYDVKDSPGICFYEDHQISLEDLRLPNGYTVRESSGRRAVALRSNDVTDQGGNVQMILLKEAFYRKAHDTYSYELSFTVEFDGRGAIVAKRNGRPFNILAITQRMKYFFTKGTIPAGVEKISFCLHSCDKGLLPGLDFVP